MVNIKIEQSRVNYVRRRWEFNKFPILSADDCIKLALTNHKVTSVSWSGGKCSTAVLHLTLKYKPNIIVTHNDTGVEFPETNEYIRKLTKEWNINLHVNKPWRTFWSIVKQYGLPQMRALGMDKKNRPPVPKCCKILKEEPVRRAYVRLGINADVDGLRVAESRVRSFALAGYGQYYYAKSYKVWRYHPIALWTKEDLDKYFTENNIPVHPLYARGIERTGCMPCTAFKGWAESLRKFNPKMYKIIMRKMGTPTMDAFIKSNKEMMDIIEEQQIKRECEQNMPKGQRTLFS